MEQVKILGIVGGISKNSLNQKLFKTVKSLAPKSVQVEFFEIGELPYFSQDLEEVLPKSVLNFKAKIEDSEAILCVTPEYNRSIPGVLKNALDWGSRPCGKNSWNGKPTGIIGASIGSGGTFGAQNHLRQILACLNMPVLCRPEFYLNASKAFDESGNLMDLKIKELIWNYWKGFESWIYTCNRVKL